MVPMLTCGFVRWNFAFAAVDPLPLFGLFGLFGLWVLLVVPGFAAALGYSPVVRSLRSSGLRPSMLTPLPPGRSAPRDFVPRCSLPCCLRDDFLCHVRGNLGVGIELHRVARPALRLGTQITD